MNIRDIDLNLLVVLNALLEQRSVTGAANVLGMSQPAVSHALNRLRKQLDDPLFIKTSKGMEPTPQASEYSEPLKKIMAELIYLVSDKEPFIPEKAEREFTIVGTDYVEVLLFPLIMAKIRKIAPGISINSIRTTDSTFNDVETGATDLIIHTFDEPLSDAFREVTLYQESFYCAAAPNHPIVCQLENNKPTLDDYLQYSHIQISRTGIGKGHSDKALSVLGLTRDVTFTIRQACLSPMIMSSRSDLISTIPRRIGELYGERLGVTCFESPLALPTVDIKMVWGPVVHTDKCHAWLRKLILELCRDEFC